MAERLAADYRYALNAFRIELIREILRLWRQMRASDATTYSE
jgi:hypothetical protein